MTETTKRLSEDLKPRDSRMMVSDHGIATTEGRWLNPIASASKTSDAIPGGRYTSGVVLFLHDRRNNLSALARRPREQLYSWRVSRSRCWCRH